MSSVEILKLLKNKCFNTEDEKVLQGQIEKVFQENNVLFDREFYLDDKNHIDFKLGTIGIEVKIKGGKRNIYKQCERYCNFESLTELILVTSKSMGMVKEINGKPIHFLNINMAWL